MTIFKSYLVAYKTVSVEPLYVFHLAKNGQVVENPFAEMQCFSVETCLRFIAISRELPKYIPESVEQFYGVEAYCFLLEVACGLHSKIQGESEIFGQIKQAWQNHEDKKSLNRTMNHLFADTKRIRTAHLHGIGGQSYAGATQKLLGLKKDHSVLVIGAGQFGAMLATKLANNVSKLMLMNRTEKKHQTLPVIAGWDNLEEAIAEADHVLVSIPCGMDLNLDNRIQTAWKNKPQRGKFIHFGQMEFAGTACQDVPDFISLSDVMALQNTQGEAKPLAVAQAFDAIKIATTERAKTRILEVA